MPIINCAVCNTAFQVVPALIKRGAKYCSNKCSGVARSKLTGDSHPRWTGGDRTKSCEHCGVTFSIRPKQPITTFRLQKFCSRPCADAGGIRHAGEDHPNYTPTARRRNRGDGHAAWARAVVSRDGATCQKCGAKDVELHAHHVLPYKEHPELRLAVSNGLTLCCVCHWHEHSALTANAVNSGNIPPGNAEDNPEPSFGRKPVEGVTTRGRAFRRWNGACSNCGSFISKRWSDVANKPHLYCNKSCMGMHRRKLLGPIQRRGSNAPKSAARESDDIV